MQLHIDAHDRSPVYRQIQHQIARAIAERRIPPGERLIDERALAVQLAVSPAAVRKAYRELKSERLCEMGLDGELRVAVPSLDPGSRADLTLTLLRKELLTDELRAAREIQQRLLPAADLFGDSWSIHGRSFPAGLLAGDFREIVEHPDGTVDLIVGDVAGKGLGAGMIMAVSRSLIAAVIHHPSPDGALQELNRRLRPILGHRDFVALAWVRFEPATGTVQIANAGLPDPYVLRADGRIESLPASGNRLPLGVREELSYCFTSRILGAADRLLLLTDGIPEAVDHHGEPLGYDGLARLLESMNQPRGDGQSDSGAWLDEFLAAAARRSTPVLEDDWTAVLLETWTQPRKSSCRS